MLCMLSGCTLGDNVWWTSVSEPIHYPSYWENKAQQRRFREMAWAALEEARALAKAESDDVAGDERGHHTRSAIRHAAEIAALEANDD